MFRSKKFKEIYKKFDGSYIDLIEEHLRVLKELEKYLIEIEKVAIADNIVSGWIWQINEKKPPCKSEKQYIAEIKEWIKNT